MIKIILNKLILLFLLFISAEISAQENYEQKLIDLLTTGRFFEAKEFYQQSENDSIFDSFFTLYYKFETAKMLYHNDSAAAFLEKLIEYKDDYFGAHKIFFYDQLLELYVMKLRDYEKSLSTCERMKFFFEENTFGIDHEKIESGLKYVEKKEREIIEKKKYPAITFSQNKLSNSIKIKEDNKLLLFDAKYNHNTHTTTFDTGVSFYFIIKDEVADSIGVKRLNFYESDLPIFLNDTILPMEEGILDSVEIANFKFCNVPVLIYKFNPISNIPDSLLRDNPERKESFEYYSKSMNIIMGYPLMFLMGSVMINLENETISFFQNDQFCTTNKQDPNLFIYKNSLYSQLEINDIPFTAHVDFGSIFYLQLYTSFHEKNKDKIPIQVVNNKKSLNISMIHNTWVDIPYEIPENPILKFNGKLVPDNGENQIEIYSLPGQSVAGTYDGHIGYPFIKNMGKRILLDFKNMRIEVIE